MSVFLVRPERNLRVERRGMREVRGVVVVCGEAFFLGGGGDEIGVDRKERYKSAVGATFIQPS